MVALFFATLLLASTAAAQDVRSLVHRARQVVSQDLDQAAALIDQALALDANDAEARYVKGRIHQRRAELPLAEAEFRAAIAAKPAYIEPRIALGEVLLAGGEPRLEEAERVFRDALALDGRNVGGLYGLAQVALARGAPEARGRLQGVLAVDADHVQARLDLGMELYAAGEYDAAAEHLTRAAELDTADPLPYFALGLVRDAQDRPEDALAAYDAALARDPDDAASLYNKAVLLESLDRPEEALAVLEHLQSVDPNASDAAMRAARILEAQGRDTALIAKLRELAARNPNDVDVRLQLAKAYLTAGKVTQAAMQFDRVLRLDPTNLAAHRALALIAEQTDDMTRAEEHYRALADVEPDSVAHKQSLVRILMKRGRQEDALALAQQAVAATGDIAARRLLIQTLSSCGQMEEAIREAQRLLGQAPNDLATLSFAASALADQGRIGEALGLYRRAMEQAPEDVALRLRYAEALEKALWHEDAAAHYTELLRQSPDLEEAFEGLVRCLERLGRIEAVAAAIEARSAELPEDFDLAMRAADAHIEARGLDAAASAAVRALKAAGSATESDLALSLLARLGAEREAAEALAARYADEPSPSLAARIARLLSPQASARRWAEAAVAGADEDDAAAAQGLLVLLDVTDLDEAAVRGDTLARAHPQSAPILTAVATIYERLGDRDTAARLFRQALDAQPDYPDAVEGLVRCGG